MLRTFKEYTHAIDLRHAYDLPIIFFMRQEMVNGEVHFVVKTVLDYDPLYSNLDKAINLSTLRVNEFDQIELNEVAYECDCEHPECVIGEFVFIHVVNEDSENTMIYDLLSRLVHMSNSPRMFNMHDDMVRWMRNNFRTGVYQALDDMQYEDTALSLNLALSKYGLNIEQARQLMSHQYFWDEYLSEHDWYELSLERIAERIFCLMHESGLRKYVEREVDGVTFSETGFIEVEYSEEWAGQKMKMFGDMRGISRDVELILERKNH